MNVRWTASNLTTPGGQNALAISAAIALTGAIMAGSAFFAGASNDESAQVLREVGVAGASDDQSARLLLEVGAGAFVFFAVITVLCMCANGRA